jgi:hypothetical protein
MNRFSRNLALLSVFAAPCFSCLLGCSEPTAEKSGPSYADLVTIFNAELQAMDRLERKREALIANHEAALGPSVEDAAQAIDALLSSANEAGKQLGLDGATDPNELLDRAVAHAEKTHDLTSGLLESVRSATEPTEEEVQKQAELTKQFERDLAAIDKQIVEQKARVERARKARDAAEAAQE